MSIFIPPKIVFTKKCIRCKLRYPVKENQCTHCYNLTDIQVESLKARYVEEQKGNSALGKQFLFYAFLISMVILLIVST